MESENNNGNWTEIIFCEKNDSNTLETFSLNDSAMTFDQLAILSNCRKLLFVTFTSLPVASITNFFVKKWQRVETNPSNIRIFPPYICFLAPHGTTLKALILMLIWKYGC
jgi:hypothetical protein